MLFNSYVFIFLFMPVAVFGFFGIARWSHRAAAAWLFSASLVFYGWWDYRYVALLVASISFNFAIGRRLAAAVNAPQLRQGLLALGVIVNLALLGYYKYAGFFVANANTLFGTSWTLTHIVLPIGISFFTFTQIAFLVDVARGEAHEYDFIHYSLFVSYFPHLVAGPILHHKEMMPQFARPETYRPNARLIAAGLTLFAIGLAKKVLIADSFAPHAETAFRPGDEPREAIGAWLGVFAYTFQLYFDFSGYSDMAIGLSLMLGIRLPLNFDSPYKARNIIEFWRRWHMTLSRFLRDYLYVPLGGNRKGPARRYVNLMVTMLLGGLWHGAAWTFVIWGGLHGLYLVVNHAWHRARDRIAPVGWAAARIPAAAYVALTFVAVMVAWVFFRAQSVDSALRLLAAMAGTHGAGLETFAAQLSTLKQTAVAVYTQYAEETGLPAPVRIALFCIELTAIPSGLVAAALLIPIGLAIAWLGINSQTLVHYGVLSEPRGLSLNYTLDWRPTLFCALAVGSLLAAALYQMLVVPPAAFLYFNF